MLNTEEQETAELWAEENDEEQSWGIRQCIELVQSHIKPLTRSKRIIPTLAILEPLDRQLGFSIFHVETEPRRRSYSIKQ